MRISPSLLVIIGLTVRHAEARPASLAVRDRDGGEPYRGAVLSRPVTDLSRRGDRSNGDGANNTMRQFSRTVGSYGPDAQLHGLGPAPGIWPDPLLDNPNDEGPFPGKGNGGKEEGQSGSSPELPVNGTDSDQSQHPGCVESCEERDFTPQIREHDWTITYGPSAPDGFLKKRILVNGQSPAPLIEVNEGDTLIVKVTNLLDEGTSIHWHGMFQNNTPFMDGIAGFSQCPIPPGGHLTYRFKIEGQYGSYWVHSHSKMQYTDGLYGGLIVHSKNDPYQKCRDYDDERVFLFADNYHDFADYIVKQLLSAQGYNGTAAAPSPQSGLINGAGQFDCAALARARGKQPGMPTRCEQLPTPTMDIEPNKKYRFRFINTGSHAQHIISIDDHEMYVIGADGTAVKPHRVHRVPIHNGQRHDVLVETNQGVDGDSFLLRSTMMTACFSFVDPLLNPVANLTLRYKLPGSDVPSRPPVPHDWKDAMGSQCQDLDDSELIPAVYTSVPPNHDINSLAIFNSQFGNLQLANGTTLGRFFVDNITQTNFVNKPYLEVTHRGGHINTTSVASLLVPDDVWVADFIINNEDTFLDHPFHLHATDMHIVARGSGSMTREQWVALNDGEAQGVNRTALNLVNPLRRDTITVTRSSYIVARIIADLPGVWAMHCHIAMHVAEGLMAAIAIHPQKIRELEFDQEVLDLCPVSVQSLNEIEPA
ncbi:potential multicopper ferro-O2-oxidoreductase [Pseudozyma hubeiensis SY62]|uniref:Potential multicopper ferro-O2-oxidoreductase n=1 Tax=Pseudozyma hubeiensis (strain SY62) TaxID=1305764 RepID=R9PBW8_PSEHS|nr:potential multicopper ferro-O2-oxidoreductase [Pseudozyma hubeiensis SY62]GAC98903.1 potential multicopper ferro-O2-oxidoreductase [Pseudozyma hubeiensis SY62]